MASFDRSGDGRDSLDLIGRVMAIEEAFSEKMIHMSSVERELLIREILDSDEFRNDDEWNDDDALAILVRRLDPKGPKGKPGLAVLPEVESDPSPEENSPKFHAPRSDDTLGDARGV